MFTYNTHKHSIMSSRGSFAHAKSTCKSNSIYIYDGCCRSYVADLLLRHHLITNMMLCYETVYLCVCLLCIAKRFTVSMCIHHVYMVELCGVTICVCVAVMLRLCSVWRTMSGYMRLEKCTGMATRILLVTVAYRKAYTNELACP